MRQNAFRTVNRCRIHQRQNLRLLVYSGLLGMLHTTKAGHSSATVFTTSTAAERMQLTAQVAVWAALAAIYVGLVNKYAPDSYMVRPRKHPAYGLLAMLREHASPGMATHSSGQLGRMWLCRTSHFMCLRRCSTARGTGIAGIQRSPLSLASTFLAWLTRVSCNCSYTVRMFRWYVSRI